MVKTKTLATIFLLIAPMTLTACSDEEHATTAAVNNTNKAAQQQEILSENSNLDLDDLINTEKDAHLQDLMHEVAQARRHANKHGFVWNTTEPLIEKGYASVKAGNEDQAKTYFQEAKMQFKLSIIQARYAAQHWELLVPKEDD